MSLAEDNNSTRQVKIAANSTALTIGGSDPSGGAGLQADLKTFQQLGVYGMSVVTLITVQNTQGVRRVETLPTELIVEQIRCVLQDFEPFAIKTGALGNAPNVEAIAAEMEFVPVPIIVDPVLVSKHGHPLGDSDVVESYRSKLIPLATIVTPNRLEAERLTGIKIQEEEDGIRAVQKLLELGPECVLIKMGEFDGKSLHFLSLGEEVVALHMPRLKANNTHGSGCILSAAITAKFALGISEVGEVVRLAIEDAFQAIQVNTELGNGIHPAEIRAIGN